MVLLFAVVGFAEVPQQTPRAVTTEPPSAVILPPLDAEFDVNADAEVVVNVGKIAFATIVTSFP